MSINMTLKELKFVREEMPGFNFSQSKPWQKDWNKVICLGGDLREQSKGEGVSEGGVGEKANQLCGMSESWLLATGVPSCWDGWELRLRVVLSVLKAL